MPLFIDAYQKRFLRKSSMLLSHIVRFWITKDVYIQRLAFELPNYGCGGNRNFSPHASIVVIVYSLGVVLNLGSKRFFAILHLGRVILAFKAVCSSMIQRWSAFGSTNKKNLGFARVNYHCYNSPFIVHLARVFHAFRCMLQDVRLV